MWTIDDHNMENLLIWLSLFVVFPLFCYGFYTLAETPIIIWLTVSALGTGIVMFFLSPIMMIFCFLLEVVIKLLIDIVNCVKQEPLNVRAEKAKAKEIVSRHRMYYEAYEKLRNE